MGAHGSHPDVKIHLSDFMWAKCVYVHLTRFFCCCFSFGFFFAGECWEGWGFMWTSVPVRQTSSWIHIPVATVSHGEAQSEAFAWYSRSLFATWQQEARGSHCELSAFSKRQKTVFKLTFPSCEGSENVTCPCFYTQHSALIFIKKDSERSHHNSAAFSIFVNELKSANTDQY